MPIYYRNPRDSAERPISLYGFSSAPKVFVAEGAAEAFFFEALFRDRNLPPDQYAVFDIYGKDKLKTALRVLSSDPLFSDVKVLGIMMDADNSPQGRLESILNNCRDIKFIGPETKIRNNGIARYQGKKLGVFVTPGKGSKGEMETLIKKEIEKSPEHPCIEEFKNCVKVQTGRNLIKKQIARIYISSIHKGVYGIAGGFDAKVLDINNPVYREPVRIFTSL